MKKRDKKCENKYTNKHSFNLLNLENRDILIVLHTKIPKLNDKKNIDIVVKMLQENYITPNKAISQYRRSIFLNVNISNVDSCF